MTMGLALLAIALVATATAMKATSLGESDRVESLPGYYDFSNDFAMYSGYLELQAQPLINVHYLFITSMRAPNTDDLVLWLNGGPGCSSLLGFAQELGPNLLSQGAKTFAKNKNPYSWNNQANMLFFESPPGVGFSVNSDPNYVYDEARTASDNLLALKLWFARFPQFSKNKFWVSGESYCGMYIPYFAHAILTSKSQIIPDGDINFQGILIGNGVMQTELHWRRRARNTFYSRHYFYGTDINKLLSNCKYTDQDVNIASCVKGNQLADEAVRRVNPYSSTGICYSHTSNGKPRSRLWYTPFDEEMYSRHEEESGCSSDDSGISAYFNNKQVQAALNMDVNTVWSSCSDNIGQTYKKAQTAIPLFQSFKKAGLKILLYSGNTDAQVSYIQTEAYIAKIGWRQTAEKIAFQNKRSNLLGWVTEYDGLSFAVINGAGHMVPSDKPHAAYEMLNWFLSKQQ